MPCSGCVISLAKRLADHYNIDWIDALTRANKGMERYEKRHNAMLIYLHSPCSNKRKPRIKTLTYKDFARLGFDPDYSQGCAESNCHCGDYSPGVCPEYARCDVACPAPLPNSHYVSDNCGSSLCECDMISKPFPRCAQIAACTEASGECLYDCDDGYLWNPWKQQCILVAVKQLLGDGLVIHEG